MIKWKDCVGKRLIVAEVIYTHDNLTEIELLEISPTQSRGKFQFQSGTIKWEQLGDWRLIEVLETVKEKET